MAPHYSRRNFLRFMSGQTAATALAPSLGKAWGSQTEPPPRFEPLKPMKEDAVVLVEGLTHDILIRWDDPIHAHGDTFGYNNDFIACLPDPDNPREAILWVNHETIDAFFVSGYRGGGKTREQVVREQRAVGGSILKVRREQGKRGWRVVYDHPINCRISGETPIKLAAERTIRGEETALGTVSNCAGGVTPWRTFLTCEENYKKFYGEVSFVNGQRKRRASKRFHWEKHFDRPPEHYGWVVEVDPLTGRCKKLTGLGRFYHESATVVRGKDGRCAVYSGDDEVDRCLYKFIAAEPGQLERGTLYVANLEAKRWIPLDMERNPALKGKFRDHTEMMIRTREAARIAGGTPLDRPEDIEYDPRSGSIFVALTNNYAKGNYYGSLLRIRERDGDPLGLQFEWETFLAGGETTGFACPDNMALDPKGNLWLTSDISENDINEGRFREFGNNGLFYIPLHGASAGRVHQVASAPMDAEFTGPCFSPDGSALFLSVQHPGSFSKYKGYLTSHWPDGGEAEPRPSVICIQGPLLDQLLA